MEVAKHTGAQVSVVKLTPFIPHYINDIMLTPFIPHYINDIMLTPFIPHYIDNVNSIYSNY